MMQLDSIYTQKFNRRCGMISGKSRDEIIYESYHNYDYTMREIGDYLGLHYATISRAVKKYEENKKHEKD